MLQKSLLTLGVLALLGACAKEPAVTDSYDPAHDYYSFAVADQFVTDHVALDLDVDFAAEVLRGSAALTLRRLDGAATELVLDTRDLAIAGVTLQGADGPVALGFRFGETDANLGTPLIIDVPLDSGDEFTLVVAYETSPESTALQWLPPELTAGGEYPLMFSQSQSIHARSWVPLQDTPAIRITYEARIHTPPDLLAVMSANNDPDAERRGDYFFDMPQPIPSYLLAIAVGNIYFAPLGEQTGVYAEPELLDASVFEFADTQEMLDQAEALFGPYEWGRYDLLVLPPSFPYGGMENPRLSFITPSLLAGDRSLVSVIAHELAHSWSGNLVTNATWRDIWLNEGMTSYLESRLMEVIYGPDRVAEHRVLMYAELQQDFESVPLRMQALAPRLDGSDPDDSQGTIHYNKGELFLLYLENAFGRETFDDFLASYFDRFAFETITTEQFLDYLDVNLLSVEGSPVTRADAEQWLYEPGLPADAPVPDSETLNTAETLALAWATGDITAAEIPVAAWSPQALIHFINSLPEDLTMEQLAALDEELGLSATSNAEIGRTWFTQAARRRYTNAYEPMEAYLMRYGRGRLIVPVYVALVDNGQDEDLARDIFSRARARYHPLTVAWIESSIGAPGE